MPRIDIPAGEDPFLYVMTKAGSPRLLASRGESWEAQHFNDSTLTPREREVARIRGAHSMGCTICQGSRLGEELEGFAQGEEIPEEIYTNILTDPGWEGYTDREKLISLFCQLYFENIEQLVEDEELWKQLKAHFTDVELVDLCLLNGFWYASARMWDVLGQAHGTCRLDSQDDEKIDLSQWLPAPAAAE